MPTDTTKENGATSNVEQSSQDKMREDMGTYRRPRFLNSVSLEGRGETQTNVPEQTSTTTTTSTSTDFDPNYFLDSLKNSADETKSLFPNQTFSDIWDSHEEQKKQEELLKQEQQRIEGKKLGYGIAGLGRIIGDMTKSTTGAKVTPADFQKMYDDLDNQRKAIYNQYYARVTAERDKERHGQALDLQWKLKQDAEKKSRDLEIAKEIAQNSLKMYKMNQDLNIHKDKMDDSALNRDLRWNIAGMRENEKSNFKEEKIGFTVNKHGMFIPKTNMSAVSSAVHRYLQKHFQQGQVSKDYYVLFDSSAFHSMPPAEQWNKVSGFLGTYALPDDDLNEILGIIQDNGGWLDNAKKQVDWRTEEEPKKKRSITNLVEKDSAETDGEGQNDFSWVE